MSTSTFLKLSTINKKGLDQLFNFSKSNHNPPLIVVTKDKGSISRGVFVFGFSLSRKLLSIVAKATFDSISPNLIPVNKVNTYNES